MSLKTYDMEKKPINERIRLLLINGSAAQRIALCENEPLYFAAYYFSEYFTYKIPPFHLDFYDDIKSLAKGTIEEAAWICFRDSAKTSIAKIALAVWCICYKKKTYINWDSYDKGNAESALFDITVALQTNKKIITDFGQLYYKKKAKDALSEAQMKRINNFITENGVKVEAFSTQEPTRGRIFGNIRPDLFIFDDFENSKTAESYPVTKKVKDHIDELKGGLPAGASVLYLANYITEEGSVAYVMENVKRNPRGKLRFVPVMSPEGVVAWPDKFVLTSKEATELNRQIDDPKRHKISLEAKRASLGKAVFEREMMNNPAHGGDKVFDREKVEELMRLAKKPLREVAGLKIWYEYNPSHRFALGADTAKGVGRDSNASAIIDFSTIPARLCATYKNNQISPDIFAYEIKREAEMFGECLVAPENNNTGYATITQLKRIYDTNKIYVPLKEEKISDKLSDEYGWETNSATKPEMVYQLKRAIEDGLLYIPDIDVLNELKYYGQKDLQTMKLVEGMTRHYDLLTAVGIAWMMKSFATVTTKKKAYKQGEYVPAAGELGG